MTEANAFDELLRRLRSGDEAATADFMRRYEPKIRRAIRVNARLQSHFDAEDVSQSVMKSFFFRARLGQFEDLRTPEQVLGLLTAMARNKHLNKIKFFSRERRDASRERYGQEQLVPDGAASPSQEAALAELLGEVPKRLSEDERLLLKQRVEDGLEWDVIAAAPGASPEERKKRGWALRKKLERAIERVARELGLDGHRT
jgi:DNA-directed RNA polymerase specialized sigma24 family protein